MITADEARAIYESKRAKPPAPSVDVEKAIKFIEEKIRQASWDGHCFIRSMFAGLGGNLYTDDEVQEIINHFDRAGFKVDPPNLLMCHFLRISIEW